MMGSQISLSKRFRTYLFLKPVNIFSGYSMKFKWHVIRLSDGTHQMDLPKQDAKKILKRKAPKEHFQKEERPKYFKATSAKKAFS